MYVDYESWETYEYKVNTLWLDSSNPRIGIKTEKNINQTQIIKFLIDNEKVYELAKKISEEGYFVGEEPIICFEDKKKVVLEGNRRTAALKILKNPQKYLTESRSKILTNNVLKNDIQVDKKLRCFISPNRLLANPIIYERHHGQTLKRWKTGNQYSFVADMFNDGLSIDNICDVLNESRAKVLKPLRAYNLFIEGQAALEEEDIILDKTTFDFTNLERFYGYKDARKILELEFDDYGHFTAKLSDEEFKKRLKEVFKLIIDSERFSREFDNEKGKKMIVDKLNNNPDFDFSSTGQTKKNSVSSEKEKRLEEEKKKTERPEKKTRNTIFKKIIPGEKEISFNNEKLDRLFTELKRIPPDKVFAFAILMRTYLEQSLYYYLEQNDLLESLNTKMNEVKRKRDLKKVESLKNFIQGKYKIDEDIDSERIMKILKFDKDKDFSDVSLKVMLEYVVKNELDDHFDSATLRNLKNYLIRIKDGLDLAVHNLRTYVDKEHNKRAWKHLEPFFDFLSNNIKSEN